MKCQSDHKISVKRESKLKVPIIAMLGDFFMYTVTLL